MMEGAFKEEYEEYRNSRMVPMSHEEWLEFRLLEEREKSKELEDKVKELRDFAWGMRELWLSTFETDDPFSDRKMAEEARRFDAEFIDAISVAF